MGALRLRLRQIAQKHLAGMQTLFGRGEILERKFSDQIGVSLAMRKPNAKMRVV
jgi:hypothetical protein